jgi:hypothetical protein
MLVVWSRKVGFVGALFTVAVGRVASDSECTPGLSCGNNVDGKFCFEVRRLDGDVVLKKVDSSTSFVGNGWVGGFVP